MPFKLPEGKNKTMKRSELCFDHMCQMRKGGTDRDRAEQISECVKAGKTIDRISVMEVEEDGPDGKPISGFFVFDGFTRGLAYELAEKEMIPVTIYKGTWNECLRAAALANKEHDAAGRHRTNADKVRALMMFAQSFDGTAKNTWPSNRETAKELEISYEMVNTYDPFGRSAVAKEEVDAGTIKDRSAKKKAKKQKTKAGPVIFDWTSYQAHIRHMVSGLDAIASQYGLKRMVEGKPVAEKELQEAEKHLEAFAKAIRAWEEKFNTKPKSGEEPQEEKTP